MKEISRAMFHLLIVTLISFSTIESFNGTPSLRGDYPWLVAILLKSHLPKFLNCTGSLISDRAVLSSVGCLKSDYLYSLEDMVVHIGHYNLTDKKENDYVVTELHRIVIHPDHDFSSKGSGDARIGIAILKTPVTFTTYIQPISLWNGNTELSEIVSRKGTVVGWSINELRERSDVPYKDETPIVSQQECLNSVISYSRFGSNRTFCAGRQDGTDLLTNGGSILLFEDGKWYLRGIRCGHVGTTTLNPDLNYYLVYADIAKHVEWINSTLNDYETINSVQNNEVTTTTGSFLTLLTNENDVCGKKETLGIPLIHHGTPSTRADYPWLVAIFQKQPRRNKYICAGSLINDRAVLTAAHCLKNENDETLQIGDIILQIGRYNLSDRREKKYVIPVLQQIITHPDYKRFNSISYDADIALIILRNSVTFTPLIRPICLWQESIKLKMIVSHEGTVVGWGKNEQGVYPETPYEIKIPIVTTRECKESNEILALMMSSRTFCAGRRDGTGPCNGDSGGALALLRDGKWHLRGIVSASLYDKATNSCDLSNYVVFTDAAKYLEWIDSYVSLF